MTNSYSEIHKELIESCKRGNSKAQFQLYAHYSKAMFNICYRMMNSKEEAEDMLQEAFTECFLKLNSFRYESSFGAWLKKIVIHKCINEIKRRKTELVFSENLEIFRNKNISVEETDDSHIDYSVNKITNAIEKLSDGYRIVFSLYLLEGYDHGEIAEILGISESTSKSQYMRAKRKIKEYLTSNGNERQIRKIYS
ncbi:MAG: sigma-70 family RNA polymerase sigma factor [Chlorobi bacterium]|nr:sigma-70 family RNA polymerase sigma factor [Chlorobiota bacterium]